MSYYLSILFSLLGVWTYLFFKFSSCLINSLPFCVHQRSQCSFVIKPTYSREVYKQQNQGVSSSATGQKEMENKWMTIFSFMFVNTTLDDESHSTR